MVPVTIYLSYLDAISTDQTTEVNKWVKNEHMAKHLLAQWVLNSTALQVQKKMTMAEMWAEIAKEYTKKGTYAQMDLCVQFLELKLAKGVNVHQS